MHSPEVKTGEAACHKSAVLRPHSCNSHVVGARAASLHIAPISNQASRASFDAELLAFTALIAAAPAKAFRDCTMAAVDDKKKSKKRKNETPEERAARKALKKQKLLQPKPRSDSFSKPAALPQTERAEASETSFAAFAKEHAVVAPKQGANLAASDAICRANSLVGAMTTIFGAAIVELLRSNFCSTL